MTSHLVAVCVDANDPTRLATFWAGLLGGEPAPDPDGGLTIAPDGDRGFRLRFVRSDAEKVGPNQAHPDLPSSSPEHQQQLVARALELGGRHIDVGQRPEEGHVVLADPEGNELCVVGPGNSFLAGTGSFGCLSSDGSPAVGHFWSQALGWPLVWDQDEETAIQAPEGGPKISWGGPPYNPRLGKVRLHLDVAPDDGDLPAEVERLVALGATRVDIGQGDVDWVVLADPDGHEFCLRPVPGRS